MAASDFQTGYHDYLNFELKIQVVDPAQIHVSLIDSPVGKANLDLDNPFTEDEIGAVLDALASSTKLPISERTKRARAFGEKLFGAVFAGAIGKAWFASLERTAGLRIRLNLDEAGSWADLPWELLRDPEMAARTSVDYLCLSPQTPVVRTTKANPKKSQVEITLPLRVLVMIANSVPDGVKQPRRNPDSEWRALQDATHEAQMRGLLELVLLDDTQLTTLQSALRSTTAYQVFHFSGGISTDQRTQAKAIALETPTHEISPLSGPGLATELSVTNGIRLAVLNVDPAIAAGAAAQGLPAAVGMRAPLSLDALQIFAQAFYAALAEGYPVETAITQARSALNRQLNNLEWASPVLYLTAPNGILYPRGKVVSVSTGGLLELLRSRALVFFGALIVIALAAFLIIPRLPKGGGSPTPPPTKVPTITDLALKGTVRFLPLSPGPGDEVTVLIPVINLGPDTAGEFDVAWFADTAQNAPSIEQSIQTLKANETTNVRNSYIFGWWGTYNTLAVVNYGHKLQDPNPSNDNRVSTLTITPDRPFVIDFLNMPDASTILETRQLTGDEFSAWGGLTIKADTEVGTSCTSAIPEIDVPELNLQSENHLVIGPTGTATLSSGELCGVVFTFTLPIGGARIHFLPQAAGQYTSDLNGKPVKTTVAANAVGITQSISTSVPATEIHKATFRGPGPLVI